MSKPVIGILLGAILGAFDGLTAWFTPAVRDQLGGIVISSTFKGIIAGVAIGFCEEVSLAADRPLFGVFIGALLAWLTARFAVGGYYFEIMLPGTLVGLIVGFATQKYGRVPAEAHS